MMSILHISTTDNYGGSGRAAYRIHTSLRDRGISSHMFVGKKVTTDTDVALIRGPLLRGVDGVCGRILDRVGYQYLFYPSSFFLPFRKWFRDADVVQLYNTHGGYFSHTSLPLLSALKPIVWRLSDLWPITGHCTYTIECGMPYEDHRGSCVHISDYPQLTRDSTDFLWRTKRWLYAHSRLTIVAPSRWIAEIVKKSPLLGRFPLVIIPNGLDIETFKPIPKGEARRFFSLDPHALVILFSAHSLLDKRKGGVYLEEALKKIVAQESFQNVTVLLMGKDASSCPVPPILRKHVIDLISDDTVLAKAYAAADVFVLPTLADNLPNGALESMACGTPVITFRVGGVPEAVRHMETGYLAAVHSSDDLARGINLLLGDRQLRERLGNNARRVALAEYTLTLQAQRYLQLYEHILSS